MIIEESKILKEKLKYIMENNDLNDKINEIDVNNDKPFTFNQKDRAVKEGEPIYTNSNKFGRSGTATAVISKNTLAIYSSDNIEYPKPINWDKITQQKRILNNGKEQNIYQKCHIIGYHLSARFTNPNNIFIGTYTLNHNAMKHIEDYIYNEVNTNNRVFLYKVTPLYFFKKDIIPVGVLFEYETIDKKEKICHCKFGFNIEIGKKINYYNGADIKFENVDKRKDEEIKELKEKSIVSKKGNSYKNYYVDVRIKKFHLVYDQKEKCKELYNVKRKYIQEVTAKYEELIDNDFKVCEECYEKGE